MAAANKNEEEKDLPGYPYYPAKDDIMNAGNVRVDVDVENLSRSSSAPPDKSVKKDTSNLEVAADMDGDKPGADITEDKKKSE